MNANRFDAVVRGLADRRLSRRSALRDLGAAGLGAALAVGASTAVARAQEATPAPGGLMVRRNASSLSPEERSAYVDAVLALKQKPSSWATGLSVYDAFVLWHRDAFNCDLNAAHMAPAFLPWHRQYLLLFEQELQAVDPTVSLIYWDWTVDNTPESSIWADNLMGGNGNPEQGYVVTTGPFQAGKWAITIFDYNDTIRNPSLIRDFGAGGLTPGLPTTEEVEAMLTIPTYDAPPWNATSPIAQSFRNTMEGWRDCVVETCDPVAGLGPTCTGPHVMHNGVHLWVAGEFTFAHQQGAHGGMATPAATTAPADSPAGSVEILGTMAANSSPNDPVFFLHHTNIDRLWNEWLRRHGPIYLPESGGPFGHNLNDPMWPYQQIGLTVTPAMMLDSRTLGYVYDTDG